MPTVCELKESLRKLGVKGYSNKSKAELERMLQSGRPVAAPLPRKVEARAVPNPAAAKYKTLAAPSVAHEEPTYASREKFPAYKAPVARKPRKLSSLEQDLLDYESLSDSDVRRYYSNLVGLSAGMLFDPAGKKRLERRLKKLKEVARSRKFSVP